MTWNEDIHECMIYLNKMEYIYFPCLHFLNSRLRYFEEIGAGVAGFEIGSGLEIFAKNAQSFTVNPSHVHAEKLP
jgi:hypothetical protein